VGLARTAKSQPRQLLRRHETSLERQANGNRRASHLRRDRFVGMKSQGASMKTRGRRRSLISRIEQIGDVDALRPPHTTAPERDASDVTLLIPAYSRTALLTVLDSRREREFRTSGALRRSQKYVDRPDSILRKLYKRQHSIGRRAKGPVSLYNTDCAPTMERRPWRLQSWPYETGLHPAQRIAA